MAIGGYLTTMVLTPAERNAALWMLQGSLNREEGSAQELTVSDNKWKYYIVKIFFALS